MKEIFKFTYRFIKYFSFWLFLLLPLQLVGSIILLLVLPFIKGNELPKYLRWFDNADMYVNRDTSTYMSVIQQGYWARYCWLAWRNPLNYFGYAVLGLVLNQPVFQTVYTGMDSLQVSDGVNGKPGLLYSEVVQDKKIYFEYYYIKKYIILGQTKCFRFRMGYKFGRAQYMKRVQFVMVISPYHSYDGV